MGDTNEPPSADTTDAELLSRLRDGDTEAYTELWRRHIQAALRVGRIVAPGQAEDLVSESFLAAYNQIVNRGNGPESTFRAYLFTTMRNTASRWRQAGRLVDTDPDLDSIELEDGLSWVEDRAEAAELLAAFKDLPERWQRVLWLSEVEEAGRGAIAAELGIKPNAVSALLKRAKQGLRLSWLSHQVPEQLRNNPEHVAHLLPPLILRETRDARPPELHAHLESCGQCAEVEADLRASHRRMRSTTLGTAGFAALGLALPAMSQTPVVAAGITLAGLTAIAASAAVVIAAGTITTDLLFNGSQRSDAPPRDQSSSESAQSSGESTGNRDRDSVDSATGSARTAEGSTRTADEPTETDARDRVLAGRYNSDPLIPEFTLLRGGQPTDFYEPPARPDAAPPGSLPPASDEPAQEGSLHSGLTNPALSSGFLAPVLAGSTAPDASIAIEFERHPDAFSSVPSTQQFLTTADSVGDWSFDLRPAITDQHGTYDYRVWAFTDDEVSSADSGQFTLSPPQIQGFEGLAPFEMMPLDEASSTGIVFHATGPAGGSICLSSVYSGQAADLPLDDDGGTTQRIRFLTGGTYYLTFRACEGEYRGPAVEIFVDVEGDEHDTYGPGLPGFGGLEPLFELTAP